MGIEVWIFIYVFIFFLFLLTIYFYYDILYIDKQVSIYKKEI